MYKNVIFINKFHGKDKGKIISFFKYLDDIIQIPKNDKNKILKDYENFIEYNHNNKMSINRILNLLPLDILNRGYAKNNNMWFPLDNSSKIYPLSMGEELMSIYRLSVYLKKDINPIILQMALNYVVIRFPVFRTSIHKGLFWNYLDGINKHFEIEEEKFIPCSTMNISMDRNELFKVTYYKNRINCEFFHVLSDAHGGMVFLMTLVAEYLRLQNKKIAYNEYVLNLNEFNEEEIRDKFKLVEVSGYKGKLIEKKAIQMDGKTSIIRPSQMIHFDLDAHLVHELAKEKKVTINELLLSFLFLVISFSTSRDGDIKIQVPVNMRKYYPTKSLRNFSLYNTISIPKKEIKSLDEIITIVKDESMKKLSKDEMDKVLYESIDLVKKVGFIPLIIKKPITKFIYYHFADKASTTVLSNMGRIDIPDTMKNEVISASFSLGTSHTNKSLFSIITINNILTLTISKYTNNTSLENNLYNLLKNYNLILKVHGSDKYEYRK